MMENSSLTGEKSLCIPNRDIFKYAEVTSFFVFGGLGVIGNLFIIILAAKYTERKNLHYLIINMAVSDIIVSIVYTPEIAKISSPVTLTNFFCKIIEFLKYTSELLTLVTLFIISIKRYQATKLAIGAQTCSNWKLISITWLISMTLSSFNLITAYATQLAPDLPFVCSHDNDSAFFRSLYLLKSLCVIILYLSVFTLSVITSVRLSKSSPIQANLSVEQRRRRARRMIGAVRMVLCSLLLYSICYLPDFIEDIIRSLDSNIGEGIREDCEQLSEFLLHVTKVVNSCFSPLVYLIFLSDFRSAAKKLICKDGPPKRSIAQETEF